MPAPICHGKMCVFLSYIHAKQSAKIWVVYSIWALSLLDGKDGDNININCDIDSLKISKYSH